MPTKGSLRALLFTRQAMFIGKAMLAGLVALSAITFGVPGRDVPSVSAASSTRVDFSYTGGPQSYLVPGLPSDMRCLKIVAFGAQGGPGENPDDTDGTPPQGGRGGKTRVFVAVPSQTTLQVYVGGKGTKGVGGFNGGGGVGSGSEEDGGGGGGASDVRIPPYALNNRLVVAGGGGGAGADNDSGGKGGAGGGSVAGAGGNSGGGTAGGRAATMASGGAAGQGDPTAQAGTWGHGGRGGSGPSAQDSGGGGGGGYYGGGGGAGEDENINDDGGGGGGGSAWPPPSPGVRHRTGARLGNGLVWIKPVDPGRCP
jgi:hypothetical protein